jgi:hypothetical protein
MIDKVEEVASSKGDWTLGKLMVASAALLKL